MLTPRKWAATHRVAQRGNGRARTFFCNDDDALASGLRGRLRRARHRRVAADGEQQVRLVAAPAVAVAEVDRRGRPAEQLLQPRLEGAREDAERRHVVAERLELPLLRVEMRERDAGVVLEDGRAVGDD